jgi:Uma2 family endonuclease
MEILSPSNEAETWANVWSYVTIPSVQEILLLHTAEMRGDLLRRQADGSWPDNPVTVAAGVTLTLESIEFSAAIDSFYRTA